VLRRLVESAFAAAVGVHDDAGDLAAAHRHRHGQRAVGQSGVVVLAEREAEYPPGGHVQDRGQVELALPGLDLGAIAVPFLVDLLRGEVPLDSAIVSIGVVKNEHMGQAFGAIRKAGTVVVVGVSNEREGAPVPGFNAITVAMFQKRIQGSLYGMSSPRDAMPNLLNLYAAGRLKLDELITRRYALDDVNQAYADMRSGVNIRGAVDFIPAG
jgi:threonine dehydrogenase-like Zn-dependent dehydrogenase